MNWYAALKNPNVPTEYVGPFQDEEQAQDYCDVQNMHLADRGIPSWVGCWTPASCW